MEATRSSESLIHFKQTTWRHIPEDILFFATAVRASIPILFQFLRKLIDTLKNGKVVPLLNCAL
jgi:hypothetical protein